MANKLLNLFNKIVKNEIATSNYFNSKRTSSLQNSVINSPSLNVTIGSGTGGIAGGITGGYLGSYEVEDRGTEYLVSIEAGSMNGIAWNATDIVIPKSSVEGDTFSGIYYIYVDSLTKTLVLSQITETTSPETINFVLMVVLVPDNPEGFIKGYTTEENITSFIYGYQANFYYYLFLMSNVVVGNTFAIDAGKITGNLIIDGNLTVTSASDSVLITSDGMYIYDVENVTSLGLDGNYTQSLLATFNKNGLFFYDGEGTVLSKFTKDEATIAGWTINADSLSGSNIILYADGGVQTVDFAEGIVGEIGNEEGWSKGTGWKIGSDGSAYFNDVTVFGTLYSSMGNIAGWEITGEYIANGNIVLASKGEIYTANYIPEISGWKIRWDGLAEFNNAIIRGTLFSDVGYIGNWNINSGIISSHSATYETATSNSVGTLTLTADAVAIIYIRDLNTGQLYQQDQVTFTAPRTIGGLQADTEHVIHYITAYDGIKLDSGGSISANYVANTSGWSINAIGDAEFNTILIRDGDFQNGELGGNWVVTDDGKLQNGTDIVLDGANKIIYFNNKSTYSADTTAGIFIGYDSGIPKVNIGSDSAFLKWTGTELLISGTISADNGDIGGWNIGPTTLSATNIILDSTGTIKTSDYSAGVFGTTTEIETKTSSGSGTITLNYPALSIVSVTVGGSGVTYTYVPQTKTLTNLIDTSTEHVITYIREDTTAGTGWKIDSTGDAVFNDVTVFGTLYSSGGNIAGWDINEGYLANGNIVLNTSGEIYTANYNHRISGWKIRYDGFAEFNNVLVRGEIESETGNIGGWLITETTLESEGETGVVMSSAGSIASKNFVIDTSGWKIFGDGTAEFADVIVRSGSLGTTGALDGWTVGEGKLQNSTDIVLDANSKRIYLNNKSTYDADTTTGIFIGYDSGIPKVNIGSDSAYLKWTGTALIISGEISAVTGDIGGWDIGATTISSNSITLTSGENPYIGIGTTTYGSAGIWLGKNSTAWKASFYADANNYLLWDGTKLTIKAANFELDASGNITASSVDLTGKITATTGTIAGWTIDGGLLKNGTDVVLDATNKKIYFNNKSSYASATAGIFMGYDTDAYKVAIGTDTSFLKWTGTELLISGNITATTGDIGGWDIDTASIYSGNVYIRSDESRFEINVSGTPKLAMGYLDGIGDFGATDFGIYVGAADAIYIEAPTEGNEVIHQIKGDWIVNHDANIIINSTVGETELEVLRLGKYGTDRGLFLFDALGSVLASYTSSGVIINVAGTNMKIGNDVASSNDGIYINDTNYWYSDGSFKLGSADSYITGSSSGIAIESTNFTVDNSGTIMAKDGTIGGWTLGAATLSSNSLTISSATDPYVGLGVTAYDTVGGIWLGSVTTGTPPSEVTTWKMSIKNSDSSEYLKWDGSKLLIKSANFEIDADGDVILTGDITAETGTIGGWTIGETTITAANIILNSTGSISANYTAGSAGWSINSAGDAEFNNVVIRATGGTLGSATGWSIQTGLLQDSTAVIKLDAANKKIKVGSYVELGSNVKTADYLGLKITADNYWETNGTYTNFSLGTKLSYTDSSGSGVLSIEGEVKATSGYIGGTASGWHIATDMLYAGTSETEYSIMLDSNTTKIGIHRPAGISYPAVSLGMAVLTGKHGLAFYDNTNGTSNNYWVWDTNEVKFRVGDNTNYLDFNVGTANKLTVVTDTFSLTTTNLTIDSATEKIAMGGIVLQGATYPYIGVGVTTYGANSGIWMGNSSGTYKLSIKNTAGSKYLLWDGTNLSIEAGNFTLDTSGNLTATNVNLTGSINATGGYIGGSSSGWEIGSGLIKNGTDIVLNATAKQITISNGAIKLGIDVESTNDGLYINATNYWYSTGSFKIGSSASYITGSSSGIAINSTNFTVDNTGTIMAKLGTIGSWKLGTSQLYAGTSTNVYSIMLDAGNTLISLYKSSTSTYPAVKLGMSVLSGKHGLAFYNNTNGTSNNYWVWDTNEVKFRIGDSTNYLSFNVDVASKLKIKTDTFDLSSSNLAIKSGASPYIGLGTETYGSTTYPGIWMGKDATWKFSLVNNSSNYLLWDSSKLTIKAANFELNSSGNIIATNVDLSGNITAITGEIGGWTINPTSISSSKLSIVSGSSPYIGIEATNFMQKGFWLGETSNNMSIIPVLFDNTYGNIEVSASLNSDNVWLAFNGNQDIVWNSGAHSNAAINIDVDFGTNTKINVVQIYFSNIDLTSKSFVIQSSSDGDSWTTVSNDCLDASGHSGWYSVSLFRVTNARYYRVLFAANQYTGSSLELGQINFSLTAVYPSDVDKFKTNVVESFPESVMDSNLSASWYGEHESSTKSLSIELEEPAEITSYRFYCNSSRYAYNPKSWTLRGSNDEINWKVVHTVIDHADFSSSTWYSYTCDTPGAYKYYEFVFTAYRNSTYVALTEIELLTSATYGFSMSNGANSYISWNNKLNIKGDLYIGAGKSSIYFEDSGIVLGDNKVAWLGSYTSRYVTFSTKYKDSRSLLMAIGYDYDGASSSTLTRFEVQNRFIDYNTPNAFRVFVNDSENSYFGSINLDFISYSSNRDNQAINHLSFLRDSDTTSVGYFKFDTSVKSVIPEWYGTKTTATTKNPNASSWTDAEDCPLSNIWVWRKTSGTPSKVLYVRLPDGNIWWVSMTEL